MSDSLAPFVVTMEEAPLPASPFFKKMHSLENDFVVLQHAGKIEPWQIKAFADRRRGIGCDQVLIWAPSEKSDIHAHLRIYNSDGCEVEACGNGTRCVMADLYQHYGVSVLQVDTKAGVLKGIVHNNQEIEVVQGQPTFLSDEPLSLGEFGFLEGFAVNMGNPHLVVPVPPDFDPSRLCALGPRLEAHSFFPDKTNVEFVSVTDQGLSLFVWERGSGRTKACASGASASVFALYKENLIDEPKALVRMEGGDLWVSLDKQGFMHHQADAYLSFQGTFEGLQALTPQKR